jgi:PII-like signaling protein
MKVLLIFLKETDYWGPGNVPLHEALVQYLFDEGIAGATVETAIMGFGAKRRLHRKGLFGVIDVKPMKITVVDEEAKLREVLPRLREMAPRSLMVCLEGEVWNEPQTGVSTE